MACYLSFVVVAFTFIRKKNKIHFSIWLADLNGKVSRLFSHVICLSHLGLVPFLGMLQKLRLTVESLGLLNGFIMH